MLLQPVTLDFETYYDQEYTLKKIKTALFIRDPRFKVQGVGIKKGGGPVRYYYGHTHIRNALAAVSWRSSLLVGHNLNFDALILTDAFGYYPAQYFDTKAIANVVLPSSERRTLDNVARLILGHTSRKLTGLAKTKGIRTLSKPLNQILKTYCIQDVNLTYDIYSRLKDALPAKETQLSSLTTRMAVEPVLEVDTGLLKEEIKRLKDRQAEVMLTCPVPKSVLSSNPQFAEWVRQSGLEVPMKASKTTGKATYAFAKDDLGFRELQATHPEHNVVWEARRVVKSTIELTRAVAFYEIGLRGLMPMPLNYYGAHTGRWSGADGLNVQNLPRGGALRRALIAPNGFNIVVLDLAQIELRLNAWFCGELGKLDVLRAGSDIYLFAASRHYGYACNKVDHPNERFFGKMLELALGYNMGWRKLRINAGLGFMGTPPVHLTQLEARNTVNKWRHANAATTATWEKLNSLLPAIHSDQRTQFNGLTFGQNRIELPNGMALQYHNLRWDAEEESWVYDSGKKLYGGILLENIIQALARIVIADQMLQVDALDGVRVIGSTHDEIISLVREDDGERLYKMQEAIMCTPPTWAPDLPLAADGGWAQNYSK